MRALTFWIAATLLVLKSIAFADVVNLSNGDRFIGSVELVNAAEIHLKSETLGLIKISRAKVSSIFFGTNQAPAANPIATIDPKSVEKVQGDFLATAGPEANDMFKELVQGLASGKLNVEDIRKQAQQSLKELKELQSEDGDETDNPLIASYVGILERFINHGATNRAKATPPKPATPAKTPAIDDE